MRDDYLMAAYIEGRRMGLEAAAQHFESCIKVPLEPKQVATMLRALAEIEEKVSPNRLNPRSKTLRVNWLNF